MARDRIFGYNDPTQYSERELNHINWDTFKKCLAGIRQASRDEDAPTPVERGFGTMIDPTYLSRKAQFDDMGGGDDSDLMADDSEGGSPKVQAVVNLLQGGANVDDVLDLLDPEDLHELVSNPQLLQSLPDEVQQAIEAHAGGGDEMDDEMDGEMGGLGGLGGGHHGHGGGDEDFGFPSSGTFGDELGAKAAEASFRRLLLRRLAEKEEGVTEYEGASSEATDHTKDQAKYEGAHEPATDHTKGQAKGRRHVDIQMKRIENPIEKVKQPEVRESANLLPKRNAKGKVIFTDPIQYSTAACEAALAMGDIPLYKTMTAARNDQRMSIANLVREMEGTEESTAPAPAAAPAKKTAKTQESNVFEKPTKMSTDKKAAFASICAKLGFPEGYVEAMTTKADEKTLIVVAEINEIGASKISRTAKAAAVKELVRVAELDSENKRHCVDYWVNQLGYDRAWVEELFMKSYGKNS